MLWTSTLALLLSDELAELVDNAVGDAYRLYRASDTLHLDILLTIYPHSVAVVDPSHPILDDPTDLIGPLERHEAVQTVAYTALTSAHMRAFGLLAQHGRLRHIILHGVDDSPEHVREVIADAPGDTLPDLTLRLLEPLITSLPDPIARAVSDIFRQPKPGRNVQDVALAAGVSRWALDRALERCNIAPCGMLLRAARVVRAYYYLQGRRIALSTIATKLGYISTRGLTSDIARMTGTVASQLTDTVDAYQLVMQVAAQLHRDYARHIMAPPPAPMPWRSPRRPLLPVLTDVPHRHPSYPSYPSYSRVQPATWPHV